MLDCMVGPSATLASHAVEFETLYESGYKMVSFKVTELAITHG